MTGSDGDAAQAAAAFHDEIPHNVQVSVSLSNHTRKVLHTIRDDLNEQAGESVLNTNDVVQLALVGAARYYGFAADGEGTADAALGTGVDHDADGLPAPDGPLLAALHDAVAADEDARL